ncbi:MAG: flagellar hook-length control protein FliK [Desulfuromonadaceae bacterium]|nr:flagellar hook-length control protein FliK [Desulfuromonadaceae bacterium]
MEMLNIPPAQPQTNPTSAPKGKTGKAENVSFQNVLGKANQSAQNDQQKGSVNSTDDEGTEFEDTVQLGEEATELDTEDTASVELTMIAPPGLPAEPALVVTESVKPAGMAPDAAIPVLAATATTPQETTAGLATESLPIDKMNVADSTQPVELAEEKASAGSRQNTPTPTDTKSMANQVMPADNPEQTDTTNIEASKQTGLMENSLGNLLQEVRPLRAQSRGRHAANLNRGETPAIAIQTEESAPVVAETKKGDSHPSFASQQDQGFSALQADAATNGTPSAINATPFEAVLEGGMHGSLATQQTSHSPQATSAEAGSIRLASGEFLRESQIVDQVLGRISVDRAGNQRIIIKMNPEELGEVKLALTMEKNQLRAQLLTQNHQVQEVLEKHLPKLHEALSQQGVKLEDIQVDVDSNRHFGQESFANQQQPESFRRHFNAPADASNNDRVHPATASARSVSTEGLSLRI